MRQQVNAHESLHPRSFRNALCITGGPGGDGCRAVTEAEQERGQGGGRSAGGRTLADSARSRRCVLSRLAPAASSSPSLHTVALFLGQGQCFARSPPQGKLVRAHLRVL